MSRGRPDDEDEYLSRDLSVFEFDVGTTPTATGTSTSSALAGDSVDLLAYDSFATTQQPSAAPQSDFGTSSLYEPYLFAYTRDDNEASATASASRAAPPPLAVIHPFPATHELQGFPPRGPGIEPYNPLPMGVQPHPHAPMQYEAFDAEYTDTHAEPAPDNTYSTRPSTATAKTSRIESQIVSDKSCKQCRQGQKSQVRQGLAEIQSKQEQQSDPRVAELEAKLATVQQQLHESTQARAAALDRGHEFRPSPPIFISDSSSSSRGIDTASTQGPGSTARTSVPPAPSSSSSSSHQSASRTFTDSIASQVLPSPTQQQIASLKAHLELERMQHGEVYVGYLSPDARMSQSVLADALTLSLLDGELQNDFATYGHVIDTSRLAASARACCSKLPSLKHLIDKIPKYKADLHALDPAGQLGVAVLCSLGARAVPHSALLGVPTQSLSDGSATPALYLSAGERREKAVRALEARANEIAWAGRVLQDDNWTNITVLAALTQLLIFEEARAKQSRFFSRNSIGMFIGLVQSKSDDEPNQEMKRSIATSLLGNDLTIGPRFQMPCQVAASEISDYFTALGVKLPDVKSTTLQNRLQDILNSEPATRDQLENSLIEVALWVCAAQWKFTRISCDRERDRAVHLEEITNLYSLIDSTHSAIQNLQQYLVGVSHVPAGCEGDPYALDHFVLLGVRADTYLVDLVNLIHDWLLKKRPVASQTTEERRNKQDFALEGDDRLVRLRWESMLRVRKCLKLIAFYSQLYLASSDKHVVHHIVVQLELLPGWTEIASQRLGSPGGPVSHEFELTDQELDWIRQALELACYFTPLAGVRLREFAEARKKHQAFAQQHEQLPLQEDPLQRQSVPDPDPNEPSEDDPMPTSEAFDSSSAQVPYVFDTSGVVWNSDSSLNVPLININDANQTRIGDVVGESGSVGSEAGDVAQDVHHGPHTHALLNQFQGQNWMDATLGDLWTSDNQSNTFANQQQQQQRQSGFFGGLSDATTPSSTIGQSAHVSEDSSNGGLSGFFRPLLGRILSSDDGQRSSSRQQSHDGDDRPRHEDNVERGSEGGPLAFANAAKALGQTWSGSDL
ncbi:hypothetical protein OIV83_006154 [Microbotryomycetes sp. JL201]|nr:hypothetical protein OIV83_006154 [Microbotryomycetes sp. JL201]